ncbi:MAG TPA: patatin-like phospholipase family protein [Microvirga sp.]|nr:patatin-like phospholipase family protein [Microvirga sp.]
MATRQVSLVLSGGVALGAYQAGAYAALHEHQDLRPQRLAGSSIGAVNAALIAGNGPEQRIERLRGFWNAVTAEPGLLGAPWGPIWTGGPWRHAFNWWSVLQARLFGRAGVFQPRMPELMLKNVNSVYDLAPMRRNVERFVDFDRLNGGEVGVAVVTTDIETGEEVVFDTGRGDRIGPDHLLATCGFLPDFAPLEIGGRLLGDGGLVANAPVEAVLLATGGGDHLCFVVDLFSPEGGRPRTLEEAAGRRWDLLFGNQSRQRLRSLEREVRLRWALNRISERLGSEATGDPELEAALAEGSDRTVTLLHLSYRAPVHEAGPEKPFDFGRASLGERWEAGELDMAAAVRLAKKGERPTMGISVRRVRRQE